MAEEKNENLEYVHSVLLNLKMIDKRSSPSDITEENLKELADRLGVKVSDVKNKSSLKSLHMLGAFTQLLDTQSMRADQSIDNLGKARTMKNYFGLPPFAFPQSSEALVYRCRGAMKVDDDDEKGHSVVNTSTVDETGASSNGQNVESVAAEINYTAQRKVAQALMKMAQSDVMRPHFVNKGGVEAVTKLIDDSSDLEVLSLCAEALFLASVKIDFCEDLVKKHVMSFVATLADKGDEETKYQCARVFCNLSKVEGRCEEVLVLNGVVGFVYSLLATTERYEFVCTLILAMCNVAPSMTENDAELAVRIFVQITKKLNVVQSYPAALFMVQIFNNLTRIPIFAVKLCEESIIPLLLRLVELHPETDLVQFSAEAFLNISLNRKNRRELASSGFATHMDRFFSIGTPLARSRILNMIGNLLHSNYFYDKIAREDIISNMLDNLLDSRQPNQFVAVAYCVSQLACVEASATVLVQCDAVKLTLGYMTEAPADAMPYMWNLLVSISQQKKYFVALAAEKEILFPLLLHHSQTENVHQGEAVALLSYNLSMHSELRDELSDKQVEVFVKTLKHIFSKFFLQRLVALNALVNIATRIPVSRSYILGNDLVTLFDSAGDVDVHMRIKFCSLLNLISCEQNCCLRLLEMGAQNSLVALQNSLASLSLKPPSTASTAKLNLDKSGSLSFKATAEKPIVKSVGADPPDQIKQVDPEMGRALIAATLHNISLRKATIGPGVLTLLLTVVRNTKTLRVLHVARCLANLSVHPKSKVALAKERKLIPLLTAVMRCGCEEAERVQHYCAIVVCNVFATNVERTLIEELIKTGSVVDLVVVILLRVNAVKTKESLGKSLFNIMARTDTREALVCNLDVLSACIELARIDSLELLSLSVRVLYNISCQIHHENHQPYAEKFGALKVAALMIARASPASPLIPGAKTTPDIRLYAAMALANMSFNDALAADLTFEKVPDAAHAIMNLRSDEASLCVATLLFNLSHQKNCVTLADSCVIPILSTLVGQGPIQCTQLAAAALCNFSTFEIFHQQLTEVAIDPMVKLMDSPQISVTVKLDAKRFLYNLVVSYQPSRQQAAMCGAIAALWKLGKTQDEDSVLISMGRIVKEICSEVGDDLVHKKVMADGIMPLLLKLSKIEIPELKLDISCSIYSMTTAGDTQRVLKWDGVDVLFWLTLHDCLGLTDTIRRNVGRALRNFTSNPAEAKMLVKEDRFMAVLRALAKSMNEDVLWQTAGVVYNLMAVEEARKIVIHRGAVTLIFELAASNYMSVRHVCSACLHMAPENMPDMEDPAVLKLVLCLLEADAEKFAELGERSLSALPYDVARIVEKSPHVAEQLPFVPTWTTITCEVDTMFTPAVVDLPVEGAMSLTIRPLGTATNPTLTHEKQSPSNFNEFKLPSDIEEEDNGWDSAEEEEGNNDDIGGKPGSRAPSRVGGGKHGINISAGPVQPLQPPSSFGKKTNNTPNIDFGKLSSEFASIKKSQNDNKQKHVVITPVEPSQVSFPRILKAKIPSDTVVLLRPQNQQGSWVSEGAGSDAKGMRASTSVGKRSLLASNSSKSLARNSHSAGSIKGLNMSASQFITPKHY